MATLKETSAFKQSMIAKGISYELFTNGMAYLKAKDRKDITYGIAGLLEANPTYTLNDMDIETIDGKVQAIVSFVETDYKGG